LESERRLFYVALTRARKGVLIGASGNPSRFLNEIQLAETGLVMDAVTHLAAGEGGAIQALKQSLQASHIRPSMLTNLICGYLPDLGQMQLAEQLQLNCRLPASIDGITVPSLTTF
jgi:hypothetical protein